MIELKIDMFTYSEWAGNYIYVSPNNNVYGLYSFDNGMKTLIIDEDITFDHYQDVINERAELKEVSDVMVYWLYSDSIVTEELYQIVREIVAEYEKDSKAFFKKYNVKGRNQMGVDVVKDKKEMRTVSNAEFITAWNDMERYWVNNDEECNDENSYYNKIINQEINIELPLLGIKTNVTWCPPTVECFDDMFKRMIDDEYVDLLVKEERCYYTGGGIWIAEVPFEYCGDSLVMVVDNEDSNAWTVYRNPLKGSTEGDSVQYEEFMVKSNNASNIEIDWQIYYIKALQLLANR